MGKHSTPSESSKRAPKTLGDSPNSNDVAGQSAVSLAGYVPVSTKTAQSDNKAGQTVPAADGTVLARRILAGFLALAAIAALVGVGVLWPRGQAPEVLPGYKETQAAAAESVTGTVIKHETGRCGSPDNGQVFDGNPRPATTTVSGIGSTAQSGGVDKECGLSVVKLTSGPDEGRNTLLETSGLPGEITLATDDEIVLSIHRNPGATPSYAFLDMNRSTALWIWMVAAVVLIVAVAKLRGVNSLIGLIITLLVVGGFLVPGLLLGYNPIALAITTGAVVLFPVIFMVHGRNWKAASALAGTLITLGISALLAHIAIATSSLRGLGDDNNLLIQLYLPNVSVTGLILAGFIIGALGVLNDVTIAQASTVHELYDANPSSTPLGVFKSAMEVGRDHISSMVYTLVLAYLGAALPLTLLLNVADRPLSQILNSDVVATELLRSAIGAMALVLAVPITTAIAAWTIRGRDR